MSLVDVPIIGHERVLGFIGLADFEREGAFGAAEVALLTTMAATVGVALESARLFDETQRLLKESEQRAAELAIVNSVQQALAAGLSMQEIYDSVGDKIGENFPNADSMEIRVLNSLTGLVEFPYVVEQGQRLSIEPQPPSGIFSHVVTTGQTLIVNENFRGHHRPAWRRSAARNIVG